MKKGKIAYNSLIRSVLRMPFLQQETRRIGRDMSVIDYPESGASGAASSLCAGQLVEDRQIAVPGQTAERRQMVSDLGTTVNTTIYGGDGKEALAFYRSVNGAWAAQMMPLWVDLALTFPVAAGEDKVAETMRIFQQLATKESVPILGGHTTFSDQVSAPVFTVSVVGTQRSWIAAAEGEKGTDRLSGPRPEDALIVTNFPGDTGAWILRQEAKETLEKRFSESFLRVTAEVQDHLCVAPAAEAGMNAVKTPQSLWMHDISEGGLYGALWEMAEGYGVGFSVQEEAVPFHQETIEICNELDVDPYYLLSTGCLLMATSDPAAVLAALQEVGIPAAMIGRVESGHQKKILHGDEIRNLDRPKQDGVMSVPTFG